MTMMVTTTGISFLHSLSTSKAPRTMNSDSRQSNTSQGEKQEVYEKGSHKFQKKRPRPRYKRVCEDVLSWTPAPLPKHDCGKSLQKDSVRVAVRFRLKLYRSCLLRFGETLNDTLQPGAVFSATLSEVLPNRQAKERPDAPHQAEATRSGPPLPGACDHQECLWPCARGKRPPQDFHRTSSRYEDNWTEDCWIFIITPIAFGIRAFLVGSSNVKNERTGSVCIPVQTTHIRP